ncbi:tRNA (uracil-5-)-methyltransferase homolog A [Bombus impatiens]|uniref:tRNA (uracil(54)-C(5))-methyltransferase n=2 Tax=Pyrobombus TaxID=144703 RepID=A0A6P8N8I9_9HYME|nr:tRNA (uracil-5-)-methyltransferase homolog A [Bombus impatiens]XP_033197993.1 tRNA (uracil-5-)-methyltransferase homolog A [Bombus vancouverensis nearcticus]XP_033311022.1 tRNA (uracil-5-)-methyltransferase homolog A [Bombus bifarius]XP_050471465.1 tRNA (uracil-5-)-methyltransferase homolog A isoform X1 [Bombus huntii]
MTSNEPTEVEKNPYAYLERADFTSEKYKIEVHGLPKYYGIGEFKKLLNEKLELQSCKIKPPKRSSGWLYVSFRNEENRRKAIEILNGILWKNCKLSAQIAKPAPDPFVKRRLEEETTKKRLKLDKDDQNISIEDKVKLTTIPLWEMPYPSQLELKQKEMSLILSTICKQMLKESKGDLLDWLNHQKTKYHGLPCELLPILSTDTITEYRNKCEFTVGKSEKENEVVIGFRLSSYAAGSTAVGPIDNLCHIPNTMKVVVKVLEEFMKNTELKPFDPVDHSGYWRQVTVRSTLCNDVMVIVGMHPQDLSSEKLEELQLQLKTFFETGNGVQARVTSLYLQIMKLKSVDEKSENNFYHISGTKYIEEMLLGMKFRISPQAFFQVNTLGAEVLYKAAIDLAKPTVDTALLDICCGTGTIGLAFSKYCGEVFGIEMIEDAIKDAKENVVANEVSNCEFFVGKAEDVLSPVIRRTTKADIIAVVDPPRAGLHQRALLTMRKAKKLSRLIYISCDPRAAAKNLVDLARPVSKQYTGEPMVPIKAVAVDMFPYTKHCELVLCLERLSTAMKARDCTER